METRFHITFMLDMNKALLIHLDVSQINSDVPMLLRVHYEKLYALPITSFGVCLSSNDLVFVHSVMLQNCCKCRNEKVLVLSNLITIILKKHGFC